MSALILAVQTATSVHSREKALFLRMNAHLHNLQPAYSYLPDVAAASAFSSASTWYQVTR